MANSPYGYWAYNNGRNGLIGGPTTVEELPDGRLVLVKDPNLPAILEDQFILYALHTSRRARADFNRIFPDLDAVSQARLAEMLLTNKREAALVLSDQAFADAIQHRNVTSGVRVSLSPALRT